MDLNTAIITIATALIGILCGAAAGSYFNLRTGRKDLMFKRKLEYFERIVKEMEENLRIHKNAILSISESAKTEEIKSSISRLKSQRKNFLIMASPLYFDTEKMTERITSFVNIEKNIFSLLENLVKKSSKSYRKRAIFDLKEHLQKLNLANQLAIKEMREELYLK